MKTFIITLLVGFGLSLSSYAKEAVAFVTHKIVINSEGKVERVVPIRVEHVNPENKETLFDFKGAMNKAVDKTMNVVSGDTFKNIYKGTEVAVTAVGTAAAAAIGGYLLYKNSKFGEAQEQKADNKTDWANMNKDIGTQEGYDKYMKERNKQAQSGNVEKEDWEILHDRKAHERQMKRKYGIDGVGPNVGHDNENDF